MYPEGLFTRTTKSCHAVSYDTMRPKLGPILTVWHGIVRHRFHCSCKRTFKGLFTHAMKILATRKNARPKLGSIPTVPGATTLQEFMVRVNRPKAWSQSYDHCIYNCIQHWNCSRLGRVFFGIERKKNFFKNALGY
jgi:hypothetical protein